MKPAFRLLGKRFGRLLVTERLKNIKGYTIWRCLCDCGMWADVRGVSLSRGNTKSCGCLLNEARKVASKTHGMRRTGTYTSWCQMRARCERPTHPNFARYGGRGIRVCARWSNFENFLADMGERPAGLTLDRINNDGNYEPGNCRWADRKTQRRNNSQLVMVTIEGRRMSLVEACERYGVSHQNAYARLYRGWSVDRALGVSDGAR